MQSRTLPATLVFEMLESLPGAGIVAGDFVVCDSATPGEDADWFIVKPLTPAALALVAGSGAGVIRLCDPPVTSESPSETLNFSTASKNSATIFGCVTMTHLCVIAVSCSVLS